MSNKQTIYILFLNNDIIVCHKHIRACHVCVNFKMLMPNEVFNLFRPKPNI